MAQRKGFMMYFEMASTLAKLSGAQVKRLVMDMYAYAEAGRAPKYDDDFALHVLWDMCKARLDADGERYDQMVLRRREAANKRWEQTRAEKESSEPQPYRSKYRTKTSAEEIKDKVNKYLDI